MRIINTRTELVPYNKTVHEHRAPTDESVALLREFEKKAEDMVYERFVVHDTPLTDIQVWLTGGFVHGHHLSRPEDKLIWNARFMLNGEIYTLSGNHDPRFPDSYHQLWKDIGYAIATKIANEIVQKAYKDFQENQAKAAK